MAIGWLMNDCRRSLPTNPTVDLFLSMTKERSPNSLCISIRNAGLASFDGDRINSRCLLTWYDAGMDENPYKAPAAKGGSGQHDEPPGRHKDLIQDLIIIAIAIPVAEIVLALVWLSGEFPPPA
jgi:hypothetical protein